MTEPGQYGCNTCKRLFATHRALLSHVGSAHTRPRDKTTKRTLTTSAKVFAKAQEGRVAPPMILTGVLEKQPKQVWIQPKDFDQLKLEATLYQRLQNQQRVNHFIHIIKADGPVRAVEISRHPNGEQWIVDGGHRFVAHQDCGVPMLANIWRTDGKIQTDQKMFSIFNNILAVNTNSKVKGWYGEIGVYIRALAEQAGSPYYKHINFGNNNKLPYPAAIFLRGIIAAMRGSVPVGNIDGQLERAEAAFADLESRARCAMFVDILPVVFPPGTRPAMYLPTIGLGRVAHERWIQAKGVYRPEAKALMRLQAVKWDTRALRNNAQFLSVIEHTIRDIWRAPK